MTSPSFGDTLSYIIALVLVVGSLAVYFTGAIVGRLNEAQEGKTRRSFNLGLPPTGSPSELFAISLVSAATTLSTIFAFFLIMAGKYGIHLLICPVFFSAGIALAIRTYREATKNGYIGETIGAGLLPHLVFHLTESWAAAAVITVLSAVSLVAILVLELRVGVSVLNSLLRGVSGSGNGSLGPFGILPVLGFLTMLLGYVFIGGFRAVLTSDIWQFKTMKIALGLALVILATFAWANGDPPSAWRLVAAGSVNFKELAGFYVEAALINLFAPVALTISWQRFGAFHSEPIDYRAACYSAIRKASLLWGTIILIGIVCRTRVAPSSARLVTDVLGTLRDPRSPWLSYVVFPLAIVAGLSGMYSSSDTCVSALLYLTESGGNEKNWRNRAVRPLDRRYYFSMAAIFLVSLGVYKLDLTSRLETVVTAIFGNVVLIAPTALLLAVCAPPTLPEEGTLRTHVVLCSIFLGVAAHWSAFFLHPPDEHRLPIAIVAGFTAASAPVVLTWKKLAKRPTKEKHAGVLEGS